MSKELTLSQKTALVRLARLPHATGKAHSAVQYGLVRRGYATPLHNGLIQLTQAGLRFAVDGTQIHNGG